MKKIKILLNSGLLNLRGGTTLGYTWFQPLRRGVLSVACGVAVAICALVAGTAHAHNLDTRATSISYASDFIGLMAQRGVANQQLVQVGDEFWVMIKTTPGPGTKTGVGGYQTFYVPPWMQIVDAAYVLSDPTDPRGFVEIPMKGQSPIAIGAGPSGAKSTPELIGFTLPGANGLGFVTAPVTASGQHRGTVAGVYGDTGIFYSTDPRTAWNSYGAAISGGTPPMVNNSGDTVGEWKATGITDPTVLGAMNLWDSYQLRAYGRKDVAPIIDYVDGRGNAPWGLANVVAGPQSGYAWEFDYETYESTPGSKADKVQAAIRIGPWQRIQYPGGQIAVDDPGSSSTMLGYAAIDASTMGYALNPASPLPADTKAVRFAIGQLELGRPEYSAVKVKITNPPLGTCFKMYGDAFGGDAGGTDNGRDHIWRYFDPTVVSLSPCTLLQKSVSKTLVAPGETFFYTIVFANNGSVPLPNISLTDTLPSGIAFLSATPAPSSSSSPVYTWNLGTVQPDSMVVITNWVKATSSGTFFNNVTARKGTEIIDSANQSVEVGTRSVLQKEKQVTPSAVAAGETVEYTITVNNAGTGGNGTPLILRDHLPPGFTYDSFVGAKLNGASIVSPTISINTADPAIATFTVSQSIQAGKALVVTFRARVGADVEPGTYFNGVELLYEGKRQPPIPEAPVSVAGGKIGDTVYHDWNGNGSQDPGEEGMAGVTMKLYESDGSTLLQTVVTDANGHYVFNGLSDETYVVKVDSGVPGAYTLTADPDATVDGQHTVTLGVDQQYLLADFGYQPSGNGSIGDTIFADNNKNGHFDSGEVGIPNVTVYLYEDTNGNGVRDAGDLLITTDTTDSAGKYLFPSLATGLSYLVYVDPSDSALVAHFDPNAYMVTTPNDFPVPSLSGDYLDADIGWFGLSPASIGDTVFMDADGNGLYNPSVDSPLAAVIVNLYLDGNLVATTITAMDGTYLFEGLAPGTYVVRVDNASPGVPEGYAPSVGPFTVVLEAGDTYLDADFPFMPLLSKSVDKSTAVVDDDLAFGVNVNYTGNQLLHDVSIRDYVPIGTTFTAAGQGGTLKTFTSTPGVPGIDTGSAGSATVTISNAANIADTWLNQDKTDFNYGNGTLTVDTEANKWKHALLRFTLPSTVPDDAVVTSASLNLTKISGNTINIAAHQMTEEWVEGTLSGATGVASWNNRMTSTPWETLGGDYDVDVADPSVSSGVATGLRTWSVAHIVQNWIDGADNYGFLLEADSSGKNPNVFASRENATPANRPSLTFSYTSTARPATTSTLSLSTDVLAVGSPVTVTLTLVSNSALTDVVPNALSVMGGGATVSGPVPASQNLLANTPATFTWTVTPTTIGEFAFAATAADGSYTFVEAHSPSLLVSPEGQNAYVLWNLGSNVAGRPGTTAQKKYLYAFQGNDNLTMWGYNTATGAWNNPTDPANTPTGVTIKEGGALTTDGTRFIYALRGDAMRVFLRYDVTTDSWDDAGIADLPGTTDKVVLKGGAMTYLNGYVYAFIGNGSKEFWRYSVADNSWTKMAIAPKVVKEGGGLTTDGVNLFATQGGDKGFWRYNVALNTWTTLSPVAAKIGNGGGLVYAEGAIYVLEGNKKKIFRRYNIGNNTWTTLAPLTANVEAGGAIAFDGTKIYVLNGKTTGFNSYDIDSNSWSTLTAAPANVGWGGALTFLQSGNVATTRATATSTLAVGETIVTLRMAVTALNTINNITANTPTWTTTNGVTASILSGPTLVSPDDDLDGTASDAVIYEWSIKVTPGTIPGRIVFSTSSSAGGTARANSVLVSPVPTFVAKVGATPIGVIRNTAYLHDGDGTFEDVPSNTTETYTSGTIGDRVWHDANGDGVQDAGEVGVAGVRVEVYASDGVTLLGFDITDATGEYRVAGLNAGDYVVKVVASTYPAGYEATTPGTLNVTLGANEQYDDADFGLWKLPIGEGRIGDRLWLDANSDGVQDEDEAGLAGITVVLERQIGGVWTTISSQTTGPDGLYAFASLIDGDYRVSIDTNSLVASPFGGSYAIGAAMAPTYDLDGISTAHQATVTLDATQRTYDTLDFGYIWSGSIGDYIWWDDNFNGVPDAGELPIGEVWVTVYFDFNGNGILDPNGGDYQVATAVTGTDGYYLVENLPPGAYLIDAYEDSITTDGVRNIVPTTGDVVYHELGAGENFLDADFGYYVGAAVEGNVFWDDNRNALFEGFELGLTNVIVTLTGTDASGNPVTRTVATDADGHFSMIVPEGDYTVTYSNATVLASYPTLKDATTATSVSFHARAGEENTTVLDFGVDNSGRIGDTIFADVNGTPGQQAGEAGLANVTVRLYANPDNSATLNGDETLLEVAITGGLGQYLFLGLADGAYLVQVATNTLPAGYNTVPTTDPTGALDSQGTAVISGGDTILTIDFGYPLIPLSYTVSGTIYNDNGAGAGTAEDGTQNGTEPGLANVSVTISVDTDGAGPNPPTIYTVTTDANGDYSLSGVPEGAIVKITVNPNTLPNMAFVQTGDPDLTKDNSTSFTMPANNVTDQNFGYFAQYGSISGTVVDGNGNGVADVGETPLAGVTITLLYAGVDGIFGTPDDLTTTTTTALDGTYSFTDLIPGNYRVTETTPAGYVTLADADGGNPNVIDVPGLAPGQNVTGRDFEDTQANRYLGDRIWHDLNGNGVQDDGELGIAGVTVRLYSAGPDGILGTTDDVLVGTQTTVGDGKYLFEELAPETYLVKVAASTLPTGFADYPTFDLDGTATSHQAVVTLDASAGRLDADFGYYPRAAIGNFVWEDIDGNGLQDDGELGLTNVIVRLYSSVSNLLEETVTDVNGQYAFTNLLPGTYFVQAVSPEGYTNTLAFAGENTAIDSDGNAAGWSSPVMAVSGETDNDIDFGFYVPANLFGYLFKDKDGSLTFNEDDTPITNAVVRLIVDGNTIATVNTDTNGYYYFADVPPGAVTLQAVQAGATLIGVPTQEESAWEDKMRNRALPSGVPYTAVITYTVLPGQGILAGVLSEPLNFGYSQHPLSTALDIKVYADADGKVMIEISTVNENGNHPIEVYAKIEGEWVLVAIIPADQIIGFGSNTYMVEAFGLNPGEFYEFKIVDESGHIFESTPIQVARSLVAVETLTLTPDLITITFKTTPGLRYQVMVCESLGAPWKVEYVQSPTKKGWSVLNNASFTAGPGTSTAVRVPRNDRAKAFFKIMQVE